jgi:hypothetical protein
VNTEAIFLTEISKLKRRSSIRFINRILLWGAVFFLSSYTILNFIAMAGLAGLDPNKLWATLLIGISLIAAIAVAFIERKDFQSLLIDIDTRLQLQDTISTAFEYHRSGDKSVFLDLLMQEATARLSRLNHYQIFPVKFSRLHFVLILVLIIAGASFFSFYSSSVLTLPTVDQRKIEKAMTLVREFARRHVTAKPQKGASHDSTITSNIRQLRETLNDPAISKEQLFDSLNKQLKEIHAKQKVLAADLQARLNDANIFNPPIPDFPDADKLNASQLARLKEILNQALNKPIPDDIYHDIESFQELLNMEEFLSQIIDEFNESYSGTEEFAESGRSQSPKSTYPGDLRKKTEDPDSPAAGGDFSDEKGSRMADLSGRSRFDSSHEDGTDVQDEQGLPHGLSPQAGTAKSDRKKKQGPEIKEAPGPEIQDKVMSAKVKQYLIRIRSQTSPGESRLREEEIVREYQQEVEGILKKEDIPLNYREYIKNYFLSIGIETSDSLK